jgi:hypothetical protein
MGVLYSVYRVTPSALMKFRADRALGEMLASAVATADLDKSWEEVLALLEGAGFGEHRTALEEMRVVATGEGDVMFATPGTVQMTAGSLATLPPVAEIAAKALAAKAPRAFGKPFDSFMADYAASNLDVIIGFWRDAAAAGDAIVLTAWA